MDLGLAGRRVIVTGATQGLGRAVTAALVNEGAHVLGCALEPADALPGVRGMVDLDLAEPDTPARIVAIAERELGGVDVVVAAAGGSISGRLEDCDDEQWAQGVAVNLVSVIRLCRAAIPMLRRSDAGRIVLFGAVSGFEPGTGNCIANVTKAGVHALTKSMSKELGRYGILVNCIAPGRIRSEQVDRLFPDDESRQAHAAGRIPLRRFGEPHEVVPLTLLLSSPTNTYITGQTISVDGGMSSRV